MTMLRSGVANAFTPEDYGQLVDLAVKANSTAARTATVVQTAKAKINFPVWKADPAVGWYAENDLIEETDGATDEVECVPSKTAGLTPISNELAEDSSPEIAHLVGGALSNQITRAIDAAYLGSTTAKGPDGLLSIAYTTVDTGASLANLDPFVTARFAAKAKGSDLTSWIVSPQTAEVLSKIKTQSGSNQSLLQFAEDGLVVAGLPVILSDQVDPATVFWGIPKDHVALVMRLGTKVETFANVHRDGLYLRAVSRLGVAFLNQPGVVRGHNAA
ncbi:MAG: phage major capsid protein [Segniliparus sp.]|uniref:phage major capsid protein n=1 Tax=Segniliparus sp. TaxID=2804064 RepID=UPI003F411F20